MEATRREIVASFKVHMRNRSDPVEITGTRLAMTDAVTQIIDEKGWAAFAAPNDQVEYIERVEEQRR